MPAPPTVVPLADWRAIRRAVRAARLVGRAVAGGVGAREATRQFAYALAGADSQTRQMALVLLASRAARGDQIADGHDVGLVWEAFARIHRPSPPPRLPLSTHSRLPVEQARAVPMERVLEALGFDLRRRGREVVTNCPFHEDHRPSLRVNTARGLWYCDPCGIGGDGIAFVQRLRGASFAEAVREVARW